MKRKFLFMRVKCSTTIYRTNFINIVQTTQS